MKVYSSADLRGQDRERVCFQVSIAIRGFVDLRVRTNTVNICPKILYQIDILFLTYLRVSLLIIPKCQGMNEEW